MLRSTFALVSFLLYINGSSSQYRTEDYAKREHSLVKPYQGVGASIPYWDLMGSTMVTNNFIRLTGDLRSMQGSIWNKVPCYTPEWEIQIHFKVHGKGKDLYGDGFSFWYVKEPMTSGPVFGNNDYFTGLAVIADTYSNHNGPHNHEHPYIAAMVNNGTLHYDHDRDGTHTQIAGCGAKFRNVDHDTVIVIKYQEDKLTVVLNIDSDRSLRECFTVDGIFLPTGYYFGVSAATGDLTDAHDIISIRFFDITSPERMDDKDRSNVIPSASFFDAPRDHVNDPPPSSLSAWKKILLLLFGVTAVCGCVFIGGLFYSKQQESKRKRFY